MKAWKRNAVIATVLVFVCAGIYLNWLYTDKTEAEDLTQTLQQEQVLGEDTLVLAENADPEAQAASEDLDGDGETNDFFATMRLSRQEARDSAVSLLQETTESEEEGDTKSSSAAALEDLMETAMQEAQIESLVIAKGYTDCVAYMSDDDISVAVSAPAEGLSQSDVALLTDIIATQSEYNLSDIRIIEVK